MTKNENDMPYHFKSTEHILKEDGFEYKITKQRLSEISQDWKRLHPILDAVPLEFKEKFNKDIPKYPSSEETSALAKMIITGLDDIYGPYDESFILAENKQDEGKHLSKREKKLISDRNPPNYPLKDLPKTQLACFEASVLTSYILRKLTDLKPEILFFEGQAQTKAQKENTEHAIVVIPEYNMLLETTDPETDPTIQPHNFKKDLKETHATKLYFDDVTYEIPQSPLSIKEKINLTFRKALDNLHYAHISTFEKNMVPLGQKMKNILQKILK